MKVWIARIDVANVLLQMHALKKLVPLQRGFKCNGAVVKSKTAGIVIQLQGDQRERARDFMLEYKIVNKAESIVMHGG